MRKFVTPKCCKEVKENATVYLSFMWPELNKILFGDLTITPKWYIRSWNKEGQSESKTVAKFCPHCAKEVPEIELRQTAKKLCVVTDGGYYCDTCKKRWSHCKCLPLEFKWKPKD